MNPDEPSSAAMWNQRFAPDAYAYGTAPNQWLKERIEALPLPDTPLALFPADGEGRNAVWAATQGWDAEVFDLSEEGAKKCQRLADQHKVSVVYQVDDLVRRSFPSHRYSLIACSWFHTPPAVRKKHMPRMLHGLKEGGHFVMEGYHTSQLGRSSGGPKSLPLLFDLNEVLNELNGPLAPDLKILYAEVEETVLDESDLHRGPAMVVRIHLVRV